MKIRVGTWAGVGLVLLGVAAVPWLPADLPIVDRVAARTQNTPDSATTNIGFRCVRDVA